MINNVDWEQIFSADTPYNMQLLLELSDGSYLTNTEIAQESFSLTETLNDSSELKFGGCNAACFKIRIRSSVPNTAKKKVTVKVYSFEQANIWIKIVSGTPMAYNIDTGSTSALPEDYFTFGTYTILTDRPTPDKKYRDITAYDVLYDVINKDVHTWYDSLYNTYTSVTLKQMRESFLNYYHIPFVSFTGVNDSVTVSKNITSSSISGKNILGSICELNGCFGFINREGKFVCKVLEPTSVKQYDRYLQGQIDYDETIANRITMIGIANDKESAVIGTAGNEYLLNSNPLLVGFSKAELESIATALLPVISVTEYRPYNVKTYGDPCVEVGDYITIPTQGLTVTSYVLDRTITGTQAMRDRLEAKGEGSNSAQVTGIVPQLYNIGKEVGDKLTIIYFNNVVEYEVGSSWVTIGNLDVSVIESQIVQLHGVIKIDVSKAGMFYIRYKVNDEYHLFIHTLQFPIDENTATIFLPIEVTNAQINRVRIEMMSPDGEGVIAVGDVHAILQGVNVISLEWDGLIEAEDFLSLTAERDLLFPLETSSVEFDMGSVTAINASDTLSLTVARDTTFNLAENVTIIRQTPVYDVVSSDEQYGIGSSDGEYYLTSSS